MKNIIIIPLLFIMSMAYAQTDRNVMWLHGLGSNSEHWQTTPDEFGDAYLVNSLVDDYATGRGIAGYRNGVFGTYDATFRNANNIFIGQSMGGVVARDILFTTPNFAGGMISMGSPLNGAHIAASLIRGDIRRVYDRATSDIGAGPIAENIGFNGGLVSFLGKTYAANKIVDMLFDRIYEDNLDREINDTHRDLSPGSAFMNTAQTRNITRPHLAIWGNENAPVAVNSAAPFTDLSKSEMRTLYNTFASFYATKEATNLAKGLSLGIFGGLYIYRAGKWRMGKVYLKDVFETDWSTLTGAIRTTSTTYCHEVMTCGWDDYFNGPSLDARSNVIKPIEDCTYMECSTYTTTIIEPSDGFIAASSQRGDLYTQRPTRVIEARGVSHHEMYSAETAKDILRDAFAGEYGNFFFTGTR